MYISQFSSKLDFAYPSVLSSILIQMAQVATMLEQMQKSGAPFSIPVLPQGVIIPPQSLLAPPNVNTTFAAPPPPAPPPLPPAAPSSAPAPPPPPSPGMPSAKATSRNVQIKKEATLQELEKQLREIISCSEISSGNVPKAVQIYLKCFGEHKEALDTLVHRYSCLIKKLPLKPKSGNSTAPFLFWQRILLELKML